MEAIQKGFLNGFSNMTAILTENKHVHHSTTHGILIRKPVLVIATLFKYVRPFCYH